MVAIQQSVSSALGSVRCGRALGGFPATVRQATRRSLLNGLATALGSARDPVVAAMARALRPIAGPDQAILIGQRHRMDAASAAFVNAVAINLLDYDDTHLPTIIHRRADCRHSIHRLGL